MNRSRPSGRKDFFEALETRRLLSVSTIWTPAATAPEWQVDKKSVELGVKFQSTVDGYAEGVRFLKGPDNIGTHTGELWDATTGLLLGSVTFTNETTSGWQEADFANPIPVQANHTYIVSYFAPVGQYSYTWFYFTGTSATSADGLLTAPASGTDGPNGVYAYSPTSTFPNLTFEDLNYWVDVVFSQTPDHPPTNVSLSNNSVLEHQPSGTVVGDFGSTDSDIGDTFTYTLEDGPGSADNASFQIVNNQLQTAAELDFASQSTYSIRVRSTDANGLSTVQIFSINVVQMNQVVGRYLFYAGSSFDSPGNNDAAIATDKTALLPGQAATFSNYSSYDRGINGIMIDVVADVQTLAPSDFTFLVGNNNDPSGWTPVSVDPTITIRPGAGTGGATRIELTWPDGTIQNQWLQVTMLADANTLLLSNYTFYFGNAIGDSGNSPTDTKVNAIDQIGVRADAGPAGITNAFDFNRDGVVDQNDETVVMTHPTSLLTDLNLITVPPNPPGMSLQPAALSAAVATSPTASDTTPVTGPVDSDPQTSLLLIDLVSQTDKTPAAYARKDQKLPAIHIKAQPAAEPTPAAVSLQILPIVPKDASHSRPADTDLQSDIGIPL